MAGTRRAEGARRAAEARSRKLRPLDLPRPVRVDTDGRGRPVRVHLSSGSRNVLVVREQWRIDDEWWRVPISRRYAAVVLEDGRPLTLYEDLVAGGWYGHGGASSTTLRWSGPLR